MRKWLNTEDGKERFEADEIAEHWHCGFYLSPVEPMQENWGLTGSEFEDYHFEIIGNVFENQDLLKTVE